MELGSNRELQSNLAALSSNWQKYKPRKIRKADHGVNRLISVKPYRATTWHKGNTEGIPPFLKKERGL